MWWIVTIFYWFDEKAGWWYIKKKEVPDSVGRLHFALMPLLVCRTRAAFCLLFSIYKVGEYCHNHADNSCHTCNNCYNSVKSHKQFLPSSIFSRSWLSWETDASLRLLPEFYFGRKAPIFAPQKAVKLAINSSDCSFI